MIRDELLAVIDVFSKPNWLPHFAVNDHSLSHCDFRNDFSAHLVLGLTRATSARQPVFERKLIYQAPQKVTVYY